MNSSPDPNCRCGCGEKTSMVRGNDASHGHRAGEFHQFVRGHDKRKASALPTGGYLVDANSGCWLWQGTLDKRGYPRTKYGGRRVFAHRFFLQMSGVDIPAGYEVDHLCRRPSCVNPVHLEAVTPTENKRRSRATKLTREQVRDIKNSSNPLPALAERFGVTRANVSQIRRGFSWKDVN